MRCRGIATSDDRHTSRCSPFEVEVFVNSNSISIYQPEQSTSERCATNGYKKVFVSDYFDGEVDEKSSSSRDYGSLNRKQDR